LKEKTIFRIILTVLANFEAKLARRTALKGVQTFFCIGFPEIDCSTSISRSACASFSQKYFIFVYLLKSRSESKYFDCI